jgi:hypothetical protein
VRPWYDNFAGAFVVISSSQVWTTTEERGIASLDVWNSALSFESVLKF